MVFVTRILVEPFGLLVEIHGAVQLLALVLDHPICTILLNGSGVDGAEMATVGLGGGVTVMTSVGLLELSLKHAPTKAKNGSKNFFMVPPLALCQYVVKVRDPKRIVPFGDRNWEIGISMARG